MCKLCACAFLLLACMAVADAFFVPALFVRKQETPAVNNNIGWGRTPGGHSPQSHPYKEYPAYPPPMPQLQQVPMPSMQQYTYEPASVMMNPYRQMQLEPQFHNVQLVPCMCPLTRDVIEQQAQSMMHNMQPPAPQQGTDSTKLGAVPSNNKGT